MDTRFFSNVEAFYQEVTPALLKKEWENSLLLGLLMQALKSGIKPLFMAIGYRLEGPVVICLQTIPNQAVFSFRSTIERSEAHTFAEVLSQTDIKHLIGKNGPTVLIAKRLADIRRAEVAIHMKQRIYALSKNQHTMKSAGILRKMEQKDMTLVTRWISDFQTCITPDRPLPMKEAKSAASQQLQKGGLFLFEVDGEPVSMANATRPLKNSLTVNLVYTPAQNRKKGYASDCVSALSRLCLDQGYDAVLLYTDLSNSTSNHIYQKIGFKPIADSISLEII